MSTDTEVDKASIITGLTPSLFYDFKLESRNLIGYSPFSEVASILAAQIPDKPLDVQNVVDITDAVTIGLIWTAA